MEPTSSEKESVNDTQEGADGTWLLDCMVQYLKSPMWTSDICDFIDDHCLSFANDVEEENSLEFTEIHK